MYFLLLSFLNLIKTYVVICLVARGLDENRMHYVTLLYCPRYYKLCSFALCECVCACVHSYMYACVCVCETELELERKIKTERERGIITPSPRVVGAENKV